MDEEGRRRLQNIWFSQQLLDWYHRNQRELPWRGSHDPYVIWLSEIIFQQTRIEQGTPYFNRFIKAFPDVFTLAAAPDDQVMKLWEGLGYYNRARNLLETARKIAYELQGRFPRDYNGLLELKGIGEYTAASVSSICFREQQAAVDGNVYRVLSRFYTEPAPIDTGQGKKRFRHLAQALIDPIAPGDFNQALMDLGSAICTTANPNCADCPLSSRCLSNRESRQLEFPVKINKIKVSKKTMHYLCVSDGTSVYIRQRAKDSIWPQLYELILLEGEKKKNELLNWFNDFTGIKLKSLPKPTTIKHKLSHQSLEINFYKIDLDSPNKIEILGYHKINKSDLNQRAFPIPIANFIARLLN